MEANPPKPDQSGMFQFLAKGRLAPAIVITHSCSLDKPRKNGRVIVAPIVPSSNLPDDAAREKAFAFENVAQFPLPGLPLPGGDYYADLKILHSLDREIVDKATRLASMTKQANLLLRRHLGGFFSRPMDDDP